MENLIIPESCILTGDILHGAKFILSNLHVHPGAMRRNLDKTGGLVMTEALMLGLAKKTGGKQAARELVQKAILDALQQEVPFMEFILAYPELHQHLKKEEIESLLLPENYLGLIDMCIDKAIKDG
jgi:3-carboxy-cis,cis-muconate cycloisomerase